MNVNELLERAKQWCVFHGQEPNAANVENLLRFWRHTQQADYWLCTDLLSNLPHYFPTTEAPAVKPFEHQEQPRKKKRKTNYDGVFFYVVFVIIAGIIIAAWQVAAVKP